VVAFQRNCCHSWGLFLNLAASVRTSQTLVVSLNTIIEYMAQDRLFQSSIHEFWTQSTASQKAFQNLDSSSSFENHHVINF
jgi:hypothetical protein